MAVVILIKFMGKTIRQQVGETPITIGRASQATVAIDDDLLSKIHCSFYIKNDYLYVSDLDSKNGVYTMDMRQIGKDEIYPAEKIIKIGNTTIEVSEESKPEILNFKREIELNQTITQKIDPKLIKSKKETTEKKASSDSFDFKIDEKVIEETTKKSKTSITIIEQLEKDQKDISTIREVSEIIARGQNIYNDEFYEEGADEVAPEASVKKLKLDKKYKKGILNRS